MPLRATRFQTTWRGTRTAKRQAPQNHSKLQVPLGGKPLLPGTRTPIILVVSKLSPEGSNISARSHTSTSRTT